MDDAITAFLIAEDDDNDIEEQDRWRAILCAAIVGVAADEQAMGRTSLRASAHSKAALWAHSHGSTNLAIPEA
jgi:hypothetical protein